MACCAARHASYACVKIGGVLLQLQPAYALACLASSKEARGCDDRADVSTLVERSHPSRRCEESQHFYDSRAGLYLLHSCASR